jgi:deaminated glutathione amidase
MTRYFRVAMVQVASDLENLNLEARKATQKAKIDRHLETILGIDPVVDLLVFPETCVAGFDPTYWVSLAESIPGPTSDYFCGKASELGKWICPGSIIERRPGEDGTHNTSLLISPLGEIVLRYSKVFVPYPFESSHRGKDFPVYEIPGVGRVGIMICADHAVPEVARNLAFEGAEIILNPTCQGPFIGGLRHLVPLSQVRAMENQCYLIVVNQAAPQGMGHSLACDPEGRILEELESEEAFAVVTIDTEEVRRVREYGSFGVSNQFLKMVRDCQEEGGPLDLCYRNGLHNAPVFETLSGRAPKTTGEITHP